MAKKAAKKGARKRTKSSAGTNQKLFLSLKAYCDLKANGPGEIKLEMDFSPPFEMLHTNFSEGVGGFNSQGPPSHYDIDSLTRLFNYITQTLPLAITRIAAKKSVKSSAKKLTVPTPIFNGNVTEYNSTIKSSAKTAKAFQANKRHITNTLSALQINRVFVDPHKKNSLIISQTTSGSGGGGDDVPPPKLP